MGARIRVTTSGPFFRGGYSRQMAAAVRDIERELAAEGADRVQDRLGEVLRNPTGFYQSNISATNNEVHDNGVVYGPWLEGVGSRNDETRFKGYSTFRKVTETLNADAERLAEPIVARRLR
jgi:hypothetical protein